MYCADVLGVFRESTPLLFRSILSSDARFQPRRGTSAARLLFNNYSERSKAINSAAPHVRIDIFLGKLINNVYKDKR